MHTLGFISAWGSGLPSPCSKLPRRATCTFHPPRMNLISHEKMEVLFNAGDTEVAKYKLDIEIPAAYSKEKRRSSISSLKQNASFKGFRKGTIPPFIMKEVPGFVLRDSVEELLQQALKELQLEPNDGEAAEPDLDYDDLKKRFEVGKDFTFSCEMALKKVASTEDSEDQELVTADGDATTSSK